MFKGHLESVVGLNDPCRSLPADIVYSDSSLILAQTPSVANRRDVRGYWPCMENSLAFQSLPESCSFLDMESLFCCGSVMQEAHKPQDIIFVCGQTFCFFKANSKLSVSKINSKTKMVKLEKERYNI